MTTRISEYMDHVVHTLTPDVDIYEAVNFLLDNHVTSAPVINESNEVLGLLSEKDCLKLLALGDANEPPSGKVEDFMSTDVTSIPPRMNIYFAAGMFLKETGRRLLVVEENKLVGAITRFDILRAIRDHMNVED